MWGQRLFYSFCLFFFCTLLTQASDLVPTNRIEYLEDEKSTRLKANFQAKSANKNFLSKSTTLESEKTSAEKFKKRFLTKDLGPLSLSLNVTNPLQVSANSLNFNLDLIQSFQLLEAGTQQFRSNLAGH